MRRLLILSASALVLAAACGKKDAKTDAAPPAPIETAAPAEAASRDHLQTMRKQIAVVDMDPDVSFLTAEEKRSSTFSMKPAR